MNVIILVKMRPKAEHMLDMSDMLSKLQAVYVNTVLGSG